MYHLKYSEANYYKPFPNSDMQNCDMLLKTCSKCGRMPLVWTLYPCTLTVILISQGLVGIINLLGLETWSSSITHVSLHSHEFLHNSIFTRYLHQKKEIFLVRSIEMNFPDITLLMKHSHSDLWCYYGSLTVLKHHCDSCCTQASLVINNHHCY